jgi:two-component system, LuxR family, response regulator FixJ
VDRGEAGICERTGFRIPDAADVGGGDRMRGGQTVHVIDDDDALRDSIRLFLTTEGFEVRTYASAVEFLTDLDTLPGGCIVTDVRMPGMSGMELLARISALGRTMPVIVVTGHADVPLAVTAMKEGAVDLLEKPFEVEDLMGSVRRALALGQDAQEIVANAEETRARLAALSARETEVLDRLVKGQPNKVIAYEMGISPRTVEVHRANVMRKTQAANLSELIRMFLNVDLGGAAGRG